MATTPKPIWSKLLEIQKEIKTFDVTDESEKIDKKGRPAYRYTPGWEIIEKIRTEMDSRSLMLLQNIKESHSTPIEYPVYRLINGQPMSFAKKEIYVDLLVEFTWMDVETGDTAGPFVMSAAGANGTDKSMASALSLAERYFLLKFFRITTREKADEPDAHDSDTLPGIPAEVQQPLQQPVQSYGQPVQAAPLPGGYQPFQPAPQNDYSAPPRYQKTPGPGMPMDNGFNPSNPDIVNAVNRLVNFEAGTYTHSQVLNECLGNLAARGLNCTNEKFVDNLVEMAQAQREGRRPNLK